MKTPAARRKPSARRKSFAQHEPYEGGATPRESGTEILSDGVLLVLKFVESHLSGSELGLLKELKPGEYIPHLQSRSPPRRPGSRGRGG